MAAMEFFRQQEKYSLIYTPLRLNMMRVMREATPSSDGVHTCTPLLMRIIVSATEKAAKASCLFLSFDVILTHLSTVRKI